MIGKFLNKESKISETSFVAPGAHLVGAVELGEYSSIWFNTVVRADINSIKIGSYTNIQDGSVIHVDDDKPVEIGDYVTIGHNALIHGCTIGDYSLIGMGAIILNGAKLGKYSKVAAGAVVCENFEVPDNALVMGVPARITREVTRQEKEYNRHWASKYSKLCIEYKKKG